MASVKERLDKLRRERRRSEAANGGAGAGAGDEGTGSSGRAQKKGSALERMRALRNHNAEQDKRDQEKEDDRRARSRARRAQREISGGGGGDSARESVLGALSTPGGGGGGGGGMDFEDDDDGSDDEGDESSEASDLDDDGKVLLLPTDLVGPDGQDDTVTFIAPPSVNRPLSFAPVPSSVLEEAEPHIMYVSANPSADLHSAQQQRQQQRQQRAREAGEEYDEEEIVAPLLEEGFFVPSAPSGTTNSNIQRLKQRLMCEAYSDMRVRNDDRVAEDKSEDELDANENEDDVNRKKHALRLLDDVERSKGWFARDGSVKVMEDPVRSVATKPVDADPMMTDETEQERCSTFLPHHVSVLTSLGALEVGNAKPVCYLDVQVRSVVLDDHPLFIKEDLIASRLRGLYRQYQHRLQASAMRYLSRRLDLEIAQATQLDLEYNDALQDHQDNNRQNINNKTNTESASTASEEMIEIGTKLRKVWDNILTSFSLRLAEELEVRGLAKSIYDQWAELKQTREDQGFASTNAKISVIETVPPVPSAHTQTHFDTVQTIVEQLDGRLERAKANRKRQAHEKQKRIENRKRRRAKRSSFDSQESSDESEFGSGSQEDDDDDNGSIGVDGGLGDALSGCVEDGLGVVSARGVAKAQEMIQQFKLTRGPQVSTARLRQQQSSSRRHSRGSNDGDGVDDSYDDDLDGGGRKNNRKGKEGMSKRARAKAEQAYYELRLSQDSSTSMDEEVNDAELRRRRAVRMATVRFAMDVNGMQVAMSPKVALTWPGFTAHLDRTFRLEVFRRPNKISVRIVDTSGLLNRGIATVPVPVPAADISNALAQSIAPVDQWYQFSSDKPMTKWLWEKPAAISRRLKDVAEQQRQLQKQQNGGSDDDDDDDDDDNEVADAMGNNERDPLNGNKSRRGKRGSLAEGGAGGAAAALGEWVGGSRDRFTSGSMWVCVAWGGRGLPGSSGGAVVRGSHSSNMRNNNHDTDASAMSLGRSGVDHASAGKHGEQHNSNVGKENGHVNDTNGRHSSKTNKHSHATLSASNGFALPNKEAMSTAGRLIGGNEEAMAGGSNAGGNSASGISPDAVAFDDKIPDFAVEVDFQKLIQDIQDLDPNDPRNDSVLRLLDVLRVSRTRGHLFRSNSVLKQVLFPTADSRRYVDSRRRALLKLRQSKGHLFQQPIPLLDDDIRRAEDLQALLLPEDEPEDEADQAGDRIDEMTRRLGGGSHDAQSRLHGFLQRVKQAQRGYSQMTRKQVSVSSVVKEGPLPQFRFEMSLFRTLFEPRRRLKPMMNARKATSMSVDKANVFVQVVRAASVPVRRSITGGLYPHSPGKSPVRQAQPRGAGGQSAFSKAQQQAGGATGAEGAVDDEADPDVNTAAVERVMSFVQVRFQGASRRCSSQEGPSPTFNESVFLPFVPPRKDFSPSNLRAIKDQVYFNVFDEVVVQSQARDFRDEDVKMERHERRYLGEFSVPFSTIYMNGKVEGMFRVEKPRVNLGYLSKGRVGTTGIDDEDEYIVGNGETADQPARLRREATNATYVYLMATLDPPLATPGNEEAQQAAIGGVGMGGGGGGGGADGAQAGEDAKLLKYAEYWVRTVKRATARARDANVNVIGTSLEGRSVFITRYLTPQAPPVDSNGEMLDTVEKLARFVSLIPFMDDWHAFADRGNAGNSDVWSTSQQFLDICAGDWEEHAVLLWNYLAYINRHKNSSQNSNVYLVLGRGIPEGNTVYVMVTTPNQPEPVFWNASTGQGFNASDLRCPLKDVAMVATSKNIWANIQETGECHKIKWNLENPKEWTKFFNEKFPRLELPSVQVEQLEYRPVEMSFVSFLESEIMDQVQRALRRWRAKKGTTRFNKVMGRKLKSMLVELEEEKLGLRRVSDKDHLSVLRETLATNEVFGFPLNMTFTDIEAVIKQVRNTDVHNTTRDNVQFAVAVGVFPYVSNVLSVWVYVCSIASSRF